MELDRISRFALDEATEFLERHLPCIHDVDLVIQLGSVHLDTTIFDEIWAEVPLCNMPYLPEEPTIAKHQMTINWGRIHDLRVLILNGRFHMYEGYGRLPVLLAIWAAYRCGARYFLLVNAAAGILPHLVPGTFMVIEDHINRLGISALMGHQHLLHTPYVDMSNVYDSVLRDLLFSVGEEMKLSIVRGIYCANLGPQFETPAEIELLRLLGVSAVGMSTVLEATLLHALQAKVVGLSLITNLGAGLTKARLSHEETLNQSRIMASKLGGFLKRCIAEISHYIQRDTQKTIKVVKSKNFTRE